MKIENICVYGMYPAVLAIRNSWDSIEKSDSFSSFYRDDENILAYNYCVIGENDRILILKLLKNDNAMGRQERKFLRQIFVGMDITTSIKHWAQIDTYKVGTVRNSQSTMHTFIKSKLTLSNFDRFIFTSTLYTINILLEIYNNIRDGKKGIEEYYDFFIKHGFTGEYTIENVLTYAFEVLDANIPGGLLLKSYWTSNYEVLKNIYHSRKNHKMYYWREFTKYIEKLPYFDLLIK